MFGPIVIMMIDAMSKEDIVEQIEQHLTKYKVNPNEENFKELGAACQMLATKDMISRKGFDQALKDIESLEKLKNLTKTVDD